MSLVKNTSKPINSPLLPTSTLLEITVTPGGTLYSLADHGDIQGGGGFKKSFEV